MKCPFEAAVGGQYPICKMLIGKDWVLGAAETKEIIDKYRLTPFALLASSSPIQINQMLDLAQESFEQSVLTPYDRGRILDRVADAVEQQAADFLEVMQAETGYTTADCRNEIDRTVQTFRLSAEEARRLKGDVIPIAGAAGQGRRIGLTLRVPLGVVLAVTPFNAPLNTVAHKIGPAIGAGNTVVLKPASQTPRTACLLAQVFLDAGLPPGHLQVFHGGGEAVTHALRDHRVRNIAFTGSTGVGA